MRCGGFFAWPFDLKSGLARTGSASTTTFRATTTINRRTADSAGRNNRMTRVRSRRGTVVESNPPNPASRDNICAMTARSAARLRAMAMVQMVGCE